MKALSRRTRVLLAVLVAAVAGAVAAGVVLARGGGAEGALTKGPPGVLAAGKFRSIIWGTTGSAAIVREAAGRLKVRLSRHFTTQPAPELFVYVARYQRGERTEWTQVAPLRSASGAQEYDLPSSAATSLDVSVAIFCTKCNKTWGEAKLRPVTPPKAGTAR
jgi:hypothetical protein